VKIRSAFFTNRFIVVWQIPAKLRETGLGLNLARRYVEAIQGRLWVESAGKDRGSVFIVTLPYEPDRSVHEMRELGH